jgi:hypothetical protein
VGFKAGAHGPNQLEHCGSGPRQRAGRASIGCWKPASDGRACHGHDQRARTDQADDARHHGHPRIQCTQTAVPTAIAKHSGSAAANPTAFASISAPALPVVGTTSHRTHSDNAPVPSVGPRTRCSRRGNHASAACAPDSIKPQKCVRGRPARRCTTWRRAGRHSATMRPGGPRYGAVGSAFRGGRVSENHERAPGRGSWWATPPGVRPDCWCVHQPN